MDALLNKHKPTYESLLLHAKLLHHLGRLEETAAALLLSIKLSHTTAQQLAVLELLAAIEDHLPTPPLPLTPATRRLRIQHELVLLIAYRWVQAVRHTADDRATAAAIHKALAQSQWSADQQHMLRQLQHHGPPAGTPRQ